jgi:adhesin HecA-like repeat protein
MDLNRSPINSKVIDGFVRSASVAKKAKASPRQAASHLHQRTQRSRTLMRTAVAKPAVKLRALDISRPKSKEQQAREARAQRVEKDARVNRFGGFVRSKNETEAVEGEFISLLQADAHKQALRRASSRGPLKRLRISRWLSISLASVGVLTVLSVLAYQRLPQVAVRVAAAQTHIKASVPGYSPVGFSFAGLAKDVNGALTIKYKSNLDNTQGFSIIQKAVSIDSSLIGSTIIPTNSQVQTSQVNGNTVYIYGPTSDASWVNNGVLYTLKDNANLPSDQIIKIVQGL